MDAQATDNSRAVKGEWTNRRALQIDSYATGQTLVHAYISRDGAIQIEVTDGNSSWKSTLQPPPGWNP